MSVRDYKSENVSIDYLCDMDSNDAETMIGKTIMAVEGTEYGIVLSLSDGTSFEANGHTFGDCSLSVFVNPKPND